MRTKTPLLLLAFCLSVWLTPSISAAHCDTLEGPVISDARLALEKGDVIPVLKWVKKEFEDEIKKAFKRTLEVRKLSPEARELADMYFFETLVRLHRTGEGAPYTGLKSEKPEPIILEADKAIDMGSVDNLVKHLADVITHGVKERFEKVLEAKKHKDESIEAGRRFVEAYVEFTHYVERLYMDAVSRDVHHEEEKKGSEVHHH
ncbi:MAG: DUF6448 family protein [Thermodesulfovibrionales bacterium]